MQELIILPHSNIDTNYFEQYFPESVFSTRTLVWDFHHFEHFDYESYITMVTFSNVVRIKNSSLITIVGEIGSIPENLLRSCVNLYEFTKQGKCRNMRS